MSILPANHSAKLARLRIILSDTSFVESRTKNLVRKVFAEEEIKLEALLISATRNKLNTIDNLFKKLDVIENRFFEERDQHDGTGVPKKLVDIMPIEDLIELYKSLGKTMTDLYKDVQEDVMALKEIEGITERKDDLSYLPKEQKKQLKDIMARVLSRISVSGGSDVK